MPTFTFPIIGQCKLQVAIATKACNIISAEANVLNISAKFQLHPHMASEEKIFFFLKIYPFGCYGTQSNSAIWTKSMFGTELHKEHFCKTFVKISAVR